MVSPGTWQELYRTDDLDEALTIVTTIAAMEFDVRWLSIDPAGAQEDDQDERLFGDPPFVIEAAPDQCADLRDVLNELRDEQWEFDRHVEQLSARRERFLICITVALTMAPIAVAMIELFDGP